MEKIGVIKTNETNAAKAFESLRHKDNIEKEYYPMVEDVENYMFNSPRLKKIIDVQIDHLLPKTIALISNDLNTKKDTKGLAKYQHFLSEFRNSISVEKGYLLDENGKLKMILHPENESNGIAEKYKGILTEEQTIDLDNHIKTMREEW